MNNKPLVSVIITTKNEEKHIGNCIESVRNQTYDNIEIIVVDNDSEDDTKKIAKEFGVKLYTLPKKIKKEIKNFRGAQVNYGVSKSKGSIIFFPDADMTFDENLINEAVKMMKDNDALYIPEIVKGSGFFGKIRNFERSFYDKTCIDAVRIIKKNLFESVGGFDTINIAFAPDDWDFTKMVKQKTSYLDITKSPLYHHEEFLNINNYLNKKKNYIDTFKDYIEKWGSEDSDVKKQLNPYYRLFKVFFEDGKWFKLLSHPINTFSMYYVRFRVAKEYLFTKIRNSNNIINKIYMVLKSNSFFYILHHFFSKNIYKVSTKMGKSIFLRPKTSDFAEFAVIFSDTEYPINKIKCKNKATIFDVGANIGLFTLYVKSHFPSTDIHTFEPAQDNYNLMLKNCKKEKNITHNNIAIGTKKQKGYLDISSSPDAYHIIKNKNQNQNRKTALCKINTLYDYCNENNISEISILKIDCEGCEFELFKDKATLDFIKKKVNKIILEIHQDFGNSINLIGNIKKQNFAVIYKGKTYAFKNKNKISSK